MKKKKQLLLALLVGVIAVFGNQTYLESRISELSPKKYVKIVRAKTRMKAGTPISSAMMESAKVPENFLPLTAIRWGNRENYAGQELLVDVLKGDYVLESYFTSRTVVGRTLSQQLDSDKYRAINLPVDETNSLARSIVVGDRIDILLTFNMPVIGQKVSVTLLQNVSVLSTGRYSQVEQELGLSGERGGRYNSLTLKLPPADALRLNYARQVGSISILLRGTTDNEILTLPPVGRVGDLLSPSDLESLTNLANELKKSALTVSDNDKLSQQLSALLDMQRKQNQTKLRK
jgi:pilus assembly protein CpaB